jgi:hypothetical protein
MRLAAVSQFALAAYVVLAGIFSMACQKQPETALKVEASQPELPAETPEQPTPEPSPAIPNLQKELLDARSASTTSPIGNFDFRNYSYEMPRGWENPDGSEITLVNGKVAPVAGNTKRDDMTDEEKATLRASRRIGLSYVTTKYFDVTGDGSEEAVVILKIGTGGTAIPQVVNIYEWKDGKPEKIWMFRTGDRADGGLKDIRAEGGLLVVELFGQDRFLLGETETGKITGDEEQLCCPTHFTRTSYKWNGSAFLMQGKRLTYSLADLNAPPLENHGDVMNDPVKSKKILAR